MQEGGGGGGDKYNAIFATELPISIPFLVYIAVRPLPTEHLSYLNTHLLHKVRVLLRVLEEKKGIMPVKDRGYLSLDLNCLKTKTRKKRTTYLEGCIQDERVER